MLPQDCRTRSLAVKKTLRVFQRVGARASVLDCASRLALWRADPRAILRHDTRSTPTRSGFTILEMLGVLAILAILAGILISNAARRLDIAAANIESTNLADYAAALQNSVLRCRYIPGPSGVSNWVQMVAAELGVGTNSVAVNLRNNRRVLMLDTNAFTLPYGQTPSGLTTPPTNRMMILSTIGPAFPATFTDGATIDFNTVWATADGTRPAFSASNPLYSWSGTGDDLKVQRINLAPFFVHLILQNYPPFPTSINQGQYTIDRSVTMVTNQVPTNGVSAYFLRNTVLGLFEDPPYSGVLDAEQILNQDASFSYIQQAWRGSMDFGQYLNNQPLSSAAIVGGTFAAAATKFRLSCYNKNASGGVTPPLVVNDIANFMSAYSIWADQGFPSATTNLMWLIQSNNLITHLCSLTNNLTPGGCNNCPP